MENKYISLLNQEICADFHKTLFNIITLDEQDNITTLFIGFNDNGQALLKVCDEKQTLISIVVGDYVCKGLTFDERSVDMTKEWIGYFANMLECFDRDKKTNYYINYISSFKNYRDEYKRVEIEKLRQKIDEETNEIITFMKNYMTIC